MIFMNDTMKNEKIEELLDNKHNIFISSYVSTLEHSFFQKMIEKKNEDKKIVYILPLKSLCNQFFAHFQSQGYSLGLITGDRRFQTNSNVWIVTPEILLSMIYKEEVNLEDIQYIVFDAFHFIQDKERGKNIQELLMYILPINQIIFLSLPITNKEVLLDQLEKDSKYPLFVLENNYKNLLKHFIYYDLHPGYYDKLPLEESQSIHQRIKKCIPLTIDVISKVYHNITEFKKSNGYVKKDYVLNNVLLECKKENKFPLACFMLSRRNLETVVNNLSVFFLSKEESNKIESICEDILEKLPNYLDYINLLEYKILLKLLKRGIGIHHGGMVPVLREMVEILLKNNHIKVIFSTETFFSGYVGDVKTILLMENMKFDGIRERNLNTQEYLSVYQKINYKFAGEVIHLPNFYSSFQLDTFETVLYPTENKYEDTFYSSVHFVLRTQCSEKFQEHSLCKREDYVQVKSLLNEKKFTFPKSYSLKGEMALQVSEIFPLFISELYEDFKKLSDKNKVCFLSCLININKNIYKEEPIDFIIEEEFVNDRIDIIKTLINHNNFIFL